MYDEAWENARAEAIMFVRNKEETAIKKWLDSIGCKEPVGYYRNIFDSTMEIYTRRPGCLIGRAGVHVEELKQILTEEFGGEWNVKFIEIRGGFVNVK